MSDKEVFAVRDLAAAYDDKFILKDITFSAEKGELMGIIGPNGAGKSTLLKVLGRMLPLAGGKVALYGKSLADYTMGEYALAASYLQQHGTIIPGFTVHEMVAVGRYPHLHWWQHGSEQDESVIQSSMAYTGVAELQHRPIETLSGGQQQRVLLAKVLAQQTEVLLLDEPAMGLDVFYQEEIFSLCQKLCCQGKTILVVAHELMLAGRFCSRLLLLGQGGLIAQGNPDAVLKEDLLSVAYGVPIQVSVNDRTGHYDIFGNAGTCTGKGGEHHG